MTRCYPVRPKTRSMVLGALFFGPCAMVLFWQALTNQDGLVIEGLIHLGPSAARVVYGVLCAVSLGFVAIACLALVVHSGRTHELVVDESGITTPGPAWRRDARRSVKFADVTEIREQKISGHHFITLMAPGRKVWLAKSHLPDGAFDEIVALVRERVRDRQHRSQH